MNEFKLGYIYAPSVLGYMQAGQYWRQFGRDYNQTVKFARSFYNARCVPEVAGNCSTKNDRFGAVAAVSEIQDDFRFTRQGLSLCKMHQD